jgi:hypothetical protein
MSLSKEFEAELFRRKILELLEKATSKDFEAVRDIAISLFQQNSALRKLLLVKMEEELVGRIEE